jgi:exopolysaccharide biosynthesis polyprenyl glycosylphosphotransferase
LSTLIIQPGGMEAPKVTHRSPLERRTALRDRRPRAVRRHTVRVATRFGVLLAGDLGALLLVRAAVDLLINANAAAGPLSSSLLAADRRHFVLLALSTLVALFATGSHSRHRALNQPARLLVAGLLAPLPLLIPPFLHLGQLSDLGPYLLTAAVIWLAVLAVRQLSEFFLQHVWPRQHGAGAALLVGRPEGTGSTIPAAIGAPGGDFAIIGHLSTRDFDADSIGTLADLRAVIDAREVEAVVVCTKLPTAQMKTIVDDCLEAGCQLLYPARAIHVAGVRPSLVWHHDQPFFELGSPVLKARALISKRIVDVIVSATLLILLAPVFLIFAILVRLDSKGPAFFLQERAGLGGRKFRMIKFRTMRAGADAEKMDLAHLNHTGDSRLFKIPDDPRTTRIGETLRRWSFDELPQLWNVLVGDMSLVGPRPFFETDFPAYADHHFRRLDAKPGITGLWQVSGRSDILNFEDVIYLDRQYIEQWSFWLDVSILVRTVPAVFRRTGAF